MYKSILLFFFLTCQFFLSAQSELMQEHIKTANNWLTHFDAETVQFDFEDKDRFRWSNLPIFLHSRKGVALEDMTDAQKRATQLLLQSVLSESGYLKVNWVLWLDERRKEEMVLEGSDVYEHYGHNKYWVSLFGIPSVTQPWSWRIEGHHLSLNVSYRNGMIQVTPFFIGAHPTVVLDGPFAGFEAMHLETKYGRQLYESFTEEQRKIAVIQDEAYDDILTRTGKEKYLKKRQGISVAELSAEQRDIVWDILKTYLGNFKYEIAARYWQKEMDTKVHIAWAGTGRYENGIYFRLQHPDWVIEYDHRNKDIAHIHSVFYDLKYAFGRQELRDEK